MLNEIKSELERLDATSTRVTIDADFEPKVGDLLKVELGDAYWHLFPQRFLELLKELPDGAGSDAVRTAIERQATFVWHGPAPDRSRDTSP